MAGTLFQPGRLTRRAAQPEDGGTWLHPNLRIRRCAHSYKPRDITVLLNVMGEGQPPFGDTPLPVVRDGTNFCLCYTVIVGNHSGEYSAS